uniref:Probable serine/threonine-protein kinase fhkE n=1 Tax=Nicotiana tabacum TaxID=4097 RepID=A0A1S4CCK4_TOBAC|nr:PREDICTED: probable serine/threonine-protein kinase fhkE [Nicotiana tabacum]
MPFTLYHLIRLYSPRLFRGGLIKLQRRATKVLFSSINEDKDRGWMVVPCMPGAVPDLKNWVRDLASTSTYAERSWRDLSKGRWESKNNGWVHCDIKPANILVFNANEHDMHKFKLVDFGLSLKVGDRMAYMTGAPLSNRGTLLYAPPESLTCGFHAKAYDIWSPIGV